MMESAEPSEYICLNCNLRFKTSRSFENHKRKFCQLQKRNSDSSLPISRGYDEPGHARSLVKTATGDDFWYRKPSASFNGSNSERKYEDYVFGVNGSSQNYGSLTKVSADMKFNSVLDDLKTEHEKLEEHKRAIQEKLANIQQNGGSSTPVSTMKMQRRSQEAFKEGRREKSIAMETHLSELKNSMARRQFSPARGDRSRQSLHQSSTEYANDNALLGHLKKLRRQYIDDGGDEKQIFEMIHNLETEIYSRKQHGGERDLQMTVKELQDQLAMSQQTNASLLKEVEMLKANRAIQGDKASIQPSGLQLVKRDFSNLHEKKLMEMKQEAEIYKQQLELERLRGELQQYRSSFSNLPQLPAIPQDQRQHSLVMSDRDMYRISNEKTEEAFEPSPYDPGNGFAIFWDFLCGIDPTSSRCRISVTMYKGSDALSDTKLLPVVSCSSSNSSRLPVSRHSGHIAILGIKQVFPRCLPLQSLTILVQVELGGQNSVSYDLLQEVGWTQVEIFDSFSRVIAGRWKVPVRVPPVAPHLTASQLNSIQQLDSCELHYRLINARDVESQDGVVLASQQTRSYKYPPLEHKLLQFADVSLEARRPVISRMDSPRPRRSSPRKESGKKKRKSNPSSPVMVSPQPIATPPVPAEEPVRKEPTPKPLAESPIVRPQPVDSPTLPTPHQDLSLQHQPPEEPSNADETKKYFLGFQIDKLYNSQEATARIQISIYGGNAKIAKAGDVLATNRSQYGKSPFLKSVIAFALEEIHFNDLRLDWNSFAIIEVYTIAGGGFLTLNQTENAEEKLICWNFIRLCNPKSNDQDESRHSILSTEQAPEEDEDVLECNTGNKELLLYSPPVLDPRRIVASFKDSRYLKKCQRNGTSLISFFIFDDKLQPPNLPLDIPIFKDEDEPPQNAWVDGKRSEAPTTQYRNGDGVELYVDAARFLPDNCAFVKVLCELYDNKYAKLKEEFDTDISLDLDPHSPEFHQKFEFRDFSYPPTTTIVFKVFMIDTITKQASWLGVCILPVFVKNGTFDRADDADSKFCVNQGNFQLKLYNQLKNIDRITKNSIESPIPCASLLVRLLRAPCHADGQPKQGADFLEDQWESEGLMVPMPKYNEGTYDTVECRPNVVECRLFHAYMKRKPTTTRECMQLIMDGKKSRNDQALANNIKNLLKNLNNLQRTDLTFLSKYDNMHGIAFAVDAAQNLPWSGFTFASYCFCPPASFYKGAIDDPAVLVTKLDLDGLIRLPKWADGMKVFPRRRSHTHLMVLIHLYEVRIIPKDNNISFSFGEQAWTIIPVCNQDFPYHGLFQVGLFHGTPTIEIIDSIQNEPIVQAIANLRKKKQIRIVDGASVFVRLGDARRREELDNLAKLPVKRNFLPRGNKFLNPVQSKRFSTIIPSNQNTEEYGKILCSKFKVLAGQVFQQRIPR